MAKTKRTNRKKKVSTSAPSTANREIARLTKLVQDSLISERKIRLSPLGKMAFDAGNAASSFFGGGKIFGSGAYAMKGGNSMWNTTNQVPVMHSGQDSIRFQHREYLGQVASSVAFTTQMAFSVNPGLAASFPYLSTMANGFQEYKFKGLVYEFKSTSADALNSTNTALGTVMMVAQYRTDAPAPTNKLQVLNEMWSSSSKPSINSFLPIECDPKESPLSVQYIRSGPVATTQDAKFYDLANVYITTQGSQAAADIGELWVTYDVELFKPVMAADAGPFVANSWSGARSTATTASPYGSIQLTSSNQGLSCSATGTTLTLPANMIGNRYLVSFSWIAATTSTSGAAVFTGCSSVAAWGLYDLTTGYATTVGQSGYNTVQESLQFIVEATASVATIAVANVLTGAASCNIKVVQVDDSYA